jgi:hypothetical protein
MRWPLVIAPLAVLSCGLELDGLGPGTASEAGTGTTGDAGAASDARDGGQGTGAEAATGTCVASIPAGWSLVLFEPSRDPCPAGLTSNDLVDDPQATASACTCPCSITAQPSCTSGTLQGGFGNASGAAACATKVPPLSISGSGCTQLQPGGPAPTSIAIEPLPASGGTCTASAVGNTTQVTSSQVRTCDVAGAGAEVVCEGSPPAGFSVCIAAAGDMACPSGSIFANRTVVAASETLVCTACSSCTVTGTCSSPLVTYYSDYLCLNAVATFPADGACTQPNWSGNLAGVEYHATVQASCAGAGSAATFQAISPQTVCCR